MLTKQEIIEALSPLKTGSYSGEDKIGPHKIVYEPLWKWLLGDQL